MYEVLIEDIGAMNSDALTERLLAELDDLSAQDRVVQEIVWGDEDITASVEEFLAQAVREDRGPLVIRSVAASALLEETLTASVGQMQALAESVDEVVHHLRCGSDDEAIAHLGSLVEGLQNIEPLLALLGSRGLLDASWVEQLIASLGSSLTEVMGAWEGENLVEMADLLQFSLRSLLIQIHDALSPVAVDLTLARLGSPS